MRGFGVPIFEVVPGIFAWKDMWLAPEARVTSAPSIGFTSRAWESNSKKKYCNDSKQSNNSTCSSVNKYYHT